MSDYFDLIKQYDFYNKYHKNKINKAIHIICIPVLVWTGGVFFSYINFNITGPYSFIYPFFGIVNFNGTSLIAIFYTSYYIILNLRLGIIMYFIFYFIQITSYYFALYVHNAWMIALTLHICSWIFQILGHLLFERNKPAFKDSLIQSFLTAPIFILIEIIKIYPLSFKQII